MLAKLRVFLIIITLMVAGCSEKVSENVQLLNGSGKQQINETQTNEAKHQTNKTLLTSIKKYAVYYGRNEVKKLSKYDLVILEPDNYSKEDIKNLKANGTIVIAYLSVGEVSSSRKYFKDVESCIIGKNPVWNSYYVNVSCNRWQEIILHERIPELLDKGFNGVFLDTVDVVDMFPNMTKDMIKFISKIRKAYPHIVIIQNRGFKIVNETARYVNGVLFESFTSRYNWNSKSYEIWSNEDLKWVDYQAENLVKLRKKYGIIVFTLDYAENETIEKKCIEHAKKFGFIPYITSINLTKI